MSDFVLVILTSEGCGHCSQFRGNGVMGNGKSMHQFSFLDSHIDPLKNGNKLNIINIHFGSMSGFHNQIQVVSKFTKIGKVIQQERYFPESGNTFVSVLTVDPKEKNNVLEKKKKVLVDGKEIKWMEFINRKIPKNIEKYAFYYPCFLLFQKENWKEGKNVLGIPNAGFVIRDAAGDYALEKNGQSLQQRNILPQKLIIKALNKELRFEPAKDLYVENPEPPKVEEVKEKEIKLEEKKEEVKKIKEVKEETVASDNRVFVIRSYHDD